MVLWRSATGYQGAVNLDPSCGCRGIIDLRYQQIDRRLDHAIDRLAYGRQIIGGPCTGRHIIVAYDRAMIGEYAGSQMLTSAQECTQFWVGLRSSFPSAEFKIHHQIGMDADMLSPRAAIRWSLDGKHDGWGSFGAPTGAQVHVMGMCHAEYGPYGPDGVGLRREFALYDEVAIWKQILIAQG